MKREQIYEKLADVFELVFDRRIELSDSLTAQNVEGWDSLMDIILISSIEEAFGVKMDIKAVQCINSVGSIVDLIEELSEK